MEQITVRLKGEKEHGIQRAEIYADGIEEALKLFAEIPLDYAMADQKATAYIKTKSKEALADTKLFFVPFDNAEKVLYVVTELKDNKELFLDKMVISPNVEITDENRLYELAKIVDTAHVIKMFYQQLGEPIQTGTYNSECEYQKQTVLAVNPLGIHF